MEVLRTGIRNARNVSRYIVGQGAASELSSLVNSMRSGNSHAALLLIDSYFEAQPEVLKRLNISDIDGVIFISTESEPTTESVDEYVAQIKYEKRDNPCVIVGMGGGSTMDVAKAVSNLLTNGGRAEDYQGWDLVREKGIYKIAIPTLSGTGAESTRTCVMTNPKTGLKLGMNSDFTVYDQIIMDPSLTSTVPRNQFFYTGMDAYIHCVESLSGSYRNAIGDAYSRQTISLCRQVFLHNDMMMDSQRENMMVASYLGGCAIATSYVGLIHPLSAGLSVVLGAPHCLANCIVMRAMEEFYPEAYSEFWTMADRQNVDVPIGICQELDEDSFRALYDATIVHEKPLTNALGNGYKEILSLDRVTELFRKM